ncbi:SDR family oxidoreductase [Mangrovibacterium diazotrophicum]|uniref:Short-subunit dehydrogenase n=1 Tax=Mangrovibacterium diazotrophicum TaxID=1261403 RepID=A0A419VYV2_9BACT|nr:SDR family oxidoreductase [Mangrovibacterium diazotrophicum]RKD88240.1 short-subunit dehydrogenase [Mangrovibacterium diazotrophicum]
MKNLKNKVVWITGASSGIGEALAYEFAREGALLVLSARNQAKLEEVREKCLQYTSKCWVQPADLSKTDEIANLVDSVIAQTGRIDFLINNAGRSQRSLAKDTPVSIDRQVMELNFFSIIALSKQVLQQMLQQGSGHLVVISSITGKFGFPWRTAYSASKHALQGYFEALRAELVNEHVDVTIVSPGRVNTNVSKNAITESGEAYNKMDDGQSNGMPADECAVQIVKAIKKNRKEVLVGKKELLMVHIRRFLPALFYKMVTNIKN